jgi:Prokaryotic lipoprotein-attachment site
MFLLQHILGGLARHHQRVVLALLLASGAALAGCGQKGPLYLPAHAIEDLSVTYFT